MQNEILIRNKLKFFLGEIENSLGETFYFRALVKNKEDMVILIKEHVYSHSNRYHLYEGNVSIKVVKVWEVEAEEYANSYNYTILN